MSLKAKIEAVIYASEEPVTLAQLIGLLGQEAQAELDQIDAAQQTLALDEQFVDDDVQEDAGDADGLNAEVIGDGQSAVTEESEVIEASAVTADESAVPDEEVAASDEDEAASEEEAAAELLAAEAVVSETTTEEAAPDEAVADAPAQAGEDPEKKIAREAKEEKEKARRLRDYFRSMLDQLMRDYASSDRGLEVREVASGFRLATKPEYHDAVRGFVKSLKPPLKLSLQALETLAVVAYKQPITAPEVSEIRGVDSGGVLGSLMTRKLVTTAGRKQVIGRPILYKTTKDFLLRFGLKDINELPSIEEFEKMAGELAEQEEIPMEAHPAEAAAEQGGEDEVPANEVPAEAHPEHHAPETAGELEAQRHTHLAQADGSPDPVDDPLDDQLADDGVEGASEESLEVAAPIEVEEEAVESKQD